MTPYSYGEKDESYALDDKVIEAANKLKDGEVSKVITTDENFYVVHMDSTFDEEKTEEKKKSIVQQRKDDHYVEVCDGYKEDVKYELNEDEWAKVKFDEFFTIKQTQEADPEESSDQQESDDAKQESNDAEKDSDADQSKDDKEDANADQSKDAEEESAEN